MTTPLTAPPTSSTWRFARWVLPFSILVAAAFLALGLWLGAQIIRAQVENRPAPIATIFENSAEIRQQLEQQQQQNQALELRINEARRALQQTNICAADPAQMPQLGPDRAAPVPPAALPPPAQGQATFQGNFAELLDQGVVLVLVRGQRGTGSGTGFFITRDLIVTNRHVIESGGEVTVASRALGRILPAQIVGQTPNSRVGNPDFALLRVPAQNIQPLALSTRAERLEQVVAVGFPALISSSDSSYRALIEGDTSGLAQLQPVLSDGRIQAVQNFPSGLKGLPHSAQISPGSSGGPLVDVCGRVIGVNTFGRSSEQMPITVSYAQKADSLQEFLRANNATAAMLNEACAPAARPAAPASGTPAPAAPAAPASGATPETAPATPPSSTR